MSIQVFIIVQLLATTRGNEWLTATNKYRCDHGAPPLKWSAAMAADAQTYVNTLSSMQHSDSYSLQPPAGPAGENLAQGGFASVTAVVAAWYSEVNDCVSLPGCENGKGGKATGHFTALVWVGAKELGCAKNTNNIYICRYKAGDTLSIDTPNMNKARGNYKPNVLAKVSNTAACDSGGSTSGGGTSGGSTSGGGTSGGSTSGNSVASASRAQFLPPFLALLFLALAQNLA